MFRRKKKWGKKIDFEIAPDVKEAIAILVDKLEFKHIPINQIYCMRSSGSRARAYARIWGLSRIFQEAAGLKPIYVIEVLSKYYDNLSPDKQIKVLIHELMHIPKNFSGALKPHRGRYHRISEREVEKIFKQNFKEK